LAHAKRSVAERAFLGADLVTERVRLIKPTQTAAAYLVGTNVTYVQAALRQQAERAAIEAGLRPLVPPLRPTLASPSARDRVTELVNEVGCNVILDILAGIEAHRFDAGLTGNGAATDGAVAH
jgi:hypothetical protein